MQTFKDTIDRTWTIDINVNALKRVRSLINVDLLELAGDENQKTEDRLIYRLMNDPVLLCDVIYCVCKPEADEKQISDEDFGRAMAGDAIDHATKALLEEIVNFFPSPRDRARAKHVLDLTWRMMDKAQNLLDEKTINDSQLEKQLENQMENHVAKMLNSHRGSLSGSLPESLESTPDP